MTFWKKVFKYSILGAHFAVNRWSWLRLALGRVDSRNRASHKNLPLEKSLEYIDRIFHDYLAYSGLNSRELEGKRVLEVGPGDNLGVALKFLAAGVAQVVSIDRFFSHRDPQQERRIYTALRERLTPAEKSRFDDSVDLSSGVRFHPEKLQYLYGRGIEQMDSDGAGKRFDLIASCAVLEEIENLDAVFSEMDRLLNPGGVQIHNIDLRDYGTLSRFGYHPLEFCTIPDWLYRYASKFSRPNRLRIDYYRRKMRELGYDAEILATYVCGSRSELNPFRAALVPGVDYTAEDLARLMAIRPRLLTRYQNVSDEDLLTAAILLVATKPLERPAQPERRNFATTVR
jgi:SAM-dependent methyltransferase